MAFAVHRVQAVYNETSLLSEEVRLIRRLLEVQGSTFARPVRVSSVSTAVQFKMALYYIMNVNDKNQLITTKIWKYTVSLNLPF
jgi:hypothetical protein